MRGILPLARLYLSGSLRRQVHLATLFLGMVLFMLPAYVNSFSLGPDAFERVSKDFGLTLIGYFILGMGCLLGASSVPADLEARSLYPVLARPLSRGGYLWAHFLAVTAMLAGSLLFLGWCLAGALALMTRQFDTGMFLALYGSLLQSAIVASICLLVSVRRSPAVAGAVGVLAFLVGSLSADLFTLALQQAGAVGPLLASLLKAALPDLSLMALKDPVIHGVTASSSYLLGVTVYAMAWMLLVLWLAQRFFEEVDL